MPSPHPNNWWRLLGSVGPPFQLHRNSQVAIPHLHNASPVPRPLITMRMEWGGPCCQTGTRQGRTTSLLAPTPHDRCIGNAHNIAAAQPCEKKWGSPGASFITNAMKEDPLGPCRHPNIYLGPTPVGSPHDPHQDFGVFIPRLSIRDISPRLCRRHFKMAGDPVMSLIY